jgi:GNAT superfamily N-acetyltransferase
VLYSKQPNNSLVNMRTKFSVKAIDPQSDDARQMINALWLEIQRRYDYNGPNDMEPESFSGPKARFWVAYSDGKPIGSIGLKNLTETRGELDAMYVEASFRRAGVAKELFNELFDFAAAHGLSKIALRTGRGQPESVAFYEKVGFRRISCPKEYDESDGTLCYELQIEN